MDNYLALANKPIIWVMCLPTVVLIIFQAWSFMKKAYQTGLDMGMAPKTLKTAIRAGAISAVGPSCAIGVGVVALMAIIGGPFGWLKLVDCGSLLYELTNIQLLAEANGTTTDALTFPMWINVIWTMAGSIIFWYLYVAFLAPKFDGVLKKVAGKDANILNRVVMGGTIGIYCKLSVPHLVKLSPATYAVLGSGLVMLFLVIIREKFGQKWLAEWSLPIAMIAGMAASVIL